ncbi:IPT/TIG domain-containing protein [Persicitalea sp.]|uniref:IPT/TIG domain-containing protein n=1 Tax=Persicitalea sp. TaxID=3100273 RepID=UPI0035945172
MKPYKPFFQSLYFLLAVTLLNCGKTKDDPAPGGGTAANPTITTFSPSSGSAGDRVLITGTGFSATLGSNKVKFGSTEALLDSASATRLVVRVPKDIVSGKISVEAGGKTVASATDFTVQQKPVSFVGTAATANTASGVTVSEARITSSIDKEGSNSVIQHGHIWSLSRAEPTLEGFNATTEGKTELGPLPAGAAFPFKFESGLKGLLPSTSYKVRAYATTAQGTVYGPISSVVTLLPCQLKSINIGNTTELQIEYDNSQRISRMINSHGNTVRYTYNAEGYVTKYEFTFAGSNNPFNVETYTYSEGRLSGIEVKTNGSTTRSNTYTYDAQGGVVKKTETAATYRIEYTYDQGVLTGVVHTRGANSPVLYTVTNGKVVKIDYGNGNYNTYAYNAEGSSTKSERFTDGKRTSWTDAKYDNTPNYGLALLARKGWLPEQVADGGGPNLITGGTQPTNYTELISQSYDGGGNLVVRTSRKKYTYEKNRVMKYDYSYSNTADNSQDEASTYTFVYQGECK